MLRITAKPGERIAIGEVTVQVLRRNGRSFEIGIEAPREVPIVRESAKLKKFAAEEKAA